jgi:hypothetical protein
MKLALKIFALLLLVALIPPATTALVLPGTLSDSAAPAAGCHEHNRKPATPEPVSYHCCQLGHKVAILQAFSSPSSSSFHWSPAMELKLAAFADMVTDFASVLTASASPPDTVPLRI